MKKVLKNYFFLILILFPSTSFASSAVIESDSFMLEVEIKTSLFDFLESKGIDTDSIHKSKIARLLAQRIAQSLNPLLEGLSFYSPRENSDDIKAPIKLSIGIDQVSLVANKPGYNVSGNGRGKEGFSLEYNPDVFWEIFQDGNDSRSFFTDKALHSVVTFALQHVAEHYIKYYSSLNFADQNTHTVAFQNTYFFLRLIKQYAFSKKGALNAYLKRSLLSQEDQPRLLAFLSQIKEQQLLPKSGLITLSHYQKVHRSIMKALQLLVYGMDKNQLNFWPLHLLSVGASDPLLLLPYLEESLNSESFHCSALLNK